MRINDHALTTGVVCGDGQREPRGVASAYEARHGNGPLPKPDRIRACCPHYGWPQGAQAERWAGRIDANGRRTTANVATVCEHCGVNGNRKLISYRQGAVSKLRATGPSGGPGHLPAYFVCRTASYDCPCEAIMTVGSHPAGVTSSANAEGGSVPIAVRA